MEVSRGNRLSSRTHVHMRDLPHISECMHSLLTQFLDLHCFLCRGKSRSTGCDVRSRMQPYVQIDLPALLLSAASASFFSILCVCSIWIVDVLHLLNDHNVCLTLAMIYTTLASKIAYLYNCELIKPAFFFLFCLLLLVFLVRDVCTFLSSSKKKSNWGRGECVFFVFLLSVTPFSLVETKCVYLLCVYRY